MTLGYRHVLLLFYFATAGRANWIRRIKVVVNTEDNRATEIMIMKPREGRRRKKLVPNHELLCTMYAYDVTIVQGHLLRISLLPCAMLGPGAEKFLSVHDGPHESLILPGMFLASNLNNHDCVQHRHRSEIVRPRGRECDSMLRTQTKCIRARSSATCQFIVAYDVSMM